jgi:hypothetical protein
MKPRHRAVVVIAVLSGAAIWLLNRPSETPTATPGSVPLAAPPTLLEPTPAASPPAVAPPQAPAAAKSTEPAIPSPQAPASPPSSAATRAAAVQLPENPLIAADVPAAPPPRRVSHVDPELALVFDQIMLMFRDYRTLTGENPVGTNEEMMKSIMGGNPKGATLGPPEGQSVNENGELIDRWGTPYFFHQIAKDRIEIRSAGPDRRLWNEDDLISD